MEKNASKKPNHTQAKSKIGNSKINKKFAAKLKQKLKSAIQNHNGAASEAKPVKAKTSEPDGNHSAFDAFKSEPKPNISGTSQQSQMNTKLPNAHANNVQHVENKSNQKITFSSSASSHKAQHASESSVKKTQHSLSNQKKNIDKNSAATKPNMPNKVKIAQHSQTTAQFSNAGAKSGHTGSKNMGNQKHSTAKHKTNQNVGVKVQVSGHVNGAKQTSTKNEKKKKKRKKKSTEPMTKLSGDAKNQDNNKRKIDDGKTINTEAKKRLKTVGGFVETSADNEEETKLVNEQLNKAKTKLKESKTAASEVAPDAPAIRVHKVTGKSSSKASGSNSDSEADSYIDKFFHDRDEDFDENRVYTLDEIESKNLDGFLSKASDDEEQSDGRSSSAMAKTTKKKPAKRSKQSASACEASPNNNIVHNEHAAVENSLDYLSSSDQSDESLSSMFETDSEYKYISLDSDDFNNTSSSSSSDSTESSVSVLRDTQRSYYCESSISSQDTYDDFLHRQHDDQSSDDDHEYMDSAYDDLRVPQGTAISHKITDERIKLFENDTQSRIIELPKSDSDDDSCVELVPITMTKAKYLRIEKQKIIAKNSELNKMKAEEERKQLAYEKSVENYYNMDTQAATEHASEVISSKSVSVVQCPSNFQHLTLNWSDDGNDSTSLQVGKMVYPQSKNTRVVSITATSTAESAAKITSSDEIQQNPDETGGSAEESEAESMEQEAPIATSTAPAPASVPIKIANPQFFNSVNSRHALLLLRRKLHFHGSLHVKLIAGKATAFGYELQHNKTVTVHSPRGHGLISLNPVRSISPSQQTFNTLDDLNADFYSQDLNHLKQEFNSETDAILLLERDHTNKGVNMIDRYMRETMFPNINAFNNESPFYSSEFVLRCKFLDEPENGLAESEQWSAINLSSTSKLVTIGGKGVGKSTFVRYLINSNFRKFQKFLFIDLDIGQPELFVPQTLSATVVTEPILGPGYLRNVKQAKAVLFGDINVLPDPIKYLRCVTKIHEFCSTHDEYSTIPWVINTMGYSRGLGKELMACILKVFKPTDVVQIQGRLHSDNFDQILEADVVNGLKFNVFENEISQIDGNCKYKIHVVDAVRGRNGPKQVDMNATDLRYAMILAKLGNCLKYNSDWLTSVKPFEASLNDLEVIVTSGEELSPSDRLDLLNGNLVYLCEKQSGSASDIVDCHGIGIVRSVDAQTNKLYLLSTIPLTELWNVNVLAIGAIPLPSAVFLNQHSQIRGAVPFVYNSDNFVGSKQVAQHIFRAESKSTNKPIQLLED